MKNFDFPYINDSPVDLSGIEGADKEQPMTELEPLPVVIEVSLDGDPPRVVNTNAYIRGKTKALQEFGYANLTQESVKEQLQHVLANHSMDEGLDVIGMFIEKDKPK